MKLVYQSVWICGGGADDQPMAFRGDDRNWRLHVHGCASLTQAQDRVLVRLDGRLFDETRCDRLVTALQRIAADAVEFCFTVWTGAAGGWASYTAASLADACRYVRMVAAVASATDQELTIATSTLRLERLLLERRGIFDEVVAAWLLDRRPDAPAIRRLFEPDRERADEGLKIVRRFGDNLVFQPYRAPTGHCWIPDQAARMRGADLSVVADRRLAQNLRAAAAVVTAGAPLLQRVRGILKVADGVRYSDYHRLSLPLTTDAAGRPETILIAVRW